MRVCFPRTSTRRRPNSKIPILVNAQAFFDGDGLALTLHGRQRSLYGGRWSERAHLRSAGAGDNTPSRAGQLQAIRGASHGRARKGRYAGVRCRGRGAHSRYCNEVSRQNNRTCIEVYQTNGAGCGILASDARFLDKVAGSRSFQTAVDKRAKHAAKGRVRARNDATICACQVSNFKTSGS